MAKENIVQQVGALSVQKATTDVNTETVKAVMPTTDLGAEQITNQTNNFLKDLSEKFAKTNVPSMIDSIPSLADATDVNAVLAPPDEASSEPVLMEWVQDPATDTLVKRPVSPVNSRDMLDRNIEMRPAHQLSTEGYPDGIRYYWASIAKGGEISQTEARSRGYVPIRSKPTNPIHMLRKVEGLGEVVTHGDLMLMGCPEQHVEAREYRAEQERLENMQGIRSHGRAMIDQVQDAYGADKVYVVQEQYRREMEMNAVTNDRDRATEMASSLLRAEQREGIRDRNGARQFAGFDGPMNRNAVPDSPNLRAR